ncbi:MAG: hypothetical protein J7K72_03110 [Candidatus Aenigmarchaeota archaeon]|nr:hypothetical protein [Candidatus Aenigmarchaeota archaeon]
MPDELIDIIDENGNIIGRKYVLLMGYGLFGLVCLGFTVSQSFPLFILLFILLGLNYALVNAKPEGICF